MDVTNQHKIVIVGSGFSGLGMGIGLLRAGFGDFVILEKAAGLGGTWRDNRYPGCACDVPSPLYSFSHELNPDWTRLFAPQQEIWEYLRGCAAKYGLDARIRYGSRVESMEWDDAARLWTVRTANGGRYRAHAVISGAGALHLPSYPQIPGIDSFAGVAFHSSRWDHSVGLAGKRVAVIGTGASAVQLVPAVARQAARLMVFQRTPPWINPRQDIPIPDGMRTALRAIPGAARGLRYAIYWMLELQALGFAVDPRLMAPAAALSRRHLERQVRDPALRARLTPDYTIGCKRILLSSDYYPALQRPNVDLVTEPIAGIVPAGLVTADGTLHEADVIVYATGFRVIGSADELHVSGRGGRKLTDAWAQGVEAYRGITVPGFPNLFLLLGPNTGLGHTSVVFMIEAQVRHVLSCLRILSREGASTIEPKAPAARAYNDALQHRLRRAVWGTGGCRSWYLDDAGINRALWPGFSFEYWARTRHARRAHYDVEP
ncbi:MAG TPA: NAD(P)/FAD-dependent oxidoreductase [Streptosporangiaceae bacterium]|nr:NAD(P)/FAD-dependent oxidoreductase [Streptosporangiaceae bacterium]